MKVKINQELEDYMHKHHHDTLSLRLVHDDLSIGDIMTRHPKINYRTPKHQERFDKYIVDDITVFIEKRIESVEDEIEFIDEKLLGVHRCAVKGVKLDYMNRWN